MNPFMIPTCIILHDYWQDNTPIAVGHAIEPGGNIAFVRCVRYHQVRNILTATFKDPLNPREQTPEIMHKMDMSNIQTPRKPPVSFTGVQHTPEPRARKSAAVRYVLHQQFRSFLTASIKDPPNPREQTPEITHHIGINSGHAP